MGAQTDEALKLAEKMLEAANAKSSAASKIAIAWFLALLLFWGGNIEVFVPKLNALYDRTRKAGDAVTQLEQFKDEKLKFGETLAQRAELVQKRTKQARGAEEARKDQLRKARVAFSVPGFPNFEVPRRYACLVWSLLLLGLLLYLSRTRIAVLKLFGRAARILRDPGHVRVLKRSSVVLFVPWWVAPLPGRDGSYVTTSQFRGLVG